MAIVGAGPAGLTAATQLAATGLNIVVLERESHAGGIPRHSDHLGYGMRDMHTFITGPTYARRLVAGATAAGADIRTTAMVTGWTEGQLDITSPRGRTRLHARAVILATGARERPRSARMIPGDRPAGVYTTGELQNLVHLHGRQIGSRAVIVGAELVSWSAVLTLRHAGCEVVLMTTTYAAPESYALFNMVGKSPALGVKVATRSRICAIIGKGRVRGVEICDVDTGDRRVVDCDTVVLTGDWIPDHELARAGGLDIDEGTLGPLVDMALHTSADGVFAAGNLLHPVDTADIAALDGRHVAGSVLNYLRNPVPPTPGDAIRITVDAPLRWIAPGIVRAGQPAPAHGRLLLWTDEFIRLPKIVVHQDGKAIAHKRLAWPAAPGRVFRVPSTILDAVRPDGGTVRISVT